MHNHSILLTVKRNWNLLIVGTLVLGFIVLLSGIFYVRARDTLEHQIKERLRGLAAVSALHLSDLDLDEIRTLADVQKPVYKEAVMQLKLIRSENPGLKFAYIIRPTDTENVFEFVADADTIDPRATIDLNEDGKIDQADALTPPGDLYDVSDNPTIQQARNFPVVSAEPYTDQWGTFIGGYAPIRTASGQFLGILALDMRINDVSAIVDTAFSPTTLLLILIAGILIAFYVTLVMWHRRLASLKRIDEERSALLSLTSHQLGTPVTIIRWALESLEHDKKAGDKKKAIADMKDGVDRLNATLHALHDAQMVDRGEINYESGHVRLQEVIEEAKAEFDHRLQKRKQTMLVTSDATLSVEFDRKLVSGVLRELVQNAIDFSPDGSSIFVRARRVGEWAVLEVEDYGCGIPGKELARITEKYYRASNATKFKPDGNGLDLYIAKGIIEKGGGKLEIESEEGKGTTVIVKLPVSE